MKKEEIISDQYPESKMLFADGFDDAILGVDDNRWNHTKGDEDDGTKKRVVYSVTKIIKVLMERDGMDYETAREHFDFNIAGGYVGVHTPVFVEDEDLE
jgi:hypothetical protein